jgi:hypothetical protein
MALVITHPDYLNFHSKKIALREYPMEYYEEFLEHIKEKYEGQYWHVLPKELARFWEENYGGKSSKWQHRNSCSNHK